MYLKGAYCNFDEGRKEGLTMEQTCILAALRVLIKQKDFETNLTQIAYLICTTRDKLRARISELEVAGFLGREEEKIVWVKPAPSAVENPQQIVENPQLGVENPHSPLNNPPTNKINYKNNSSCLAGDAATPQPKQDIFIIPSFEELLSYGRERGYDFKEMKKYYQYYSGNGWTLKRGAKMKSWQATLGFWMSRVEEKKACAAAAKFATLAQAGFRPENRAYEHACAMKSRAADAQDIASAKKEAEILSDEDRQANFELISRLSKKFCTTI